MKKTNKDLRPIISNRKASFDYIFEETYNAGIILTGSEVKSIRNSHVKMNDSYCYFIKNELFIFNLEISQYKYQLKKEDIKLHKLLLTKLELKKLKQSLIKGYTIIPSKIYFNDRNIVKIEINLAKGKTNYDKRQTLKEKDSIKIDGY